VHQKHHLEALDLVDLLTKKLTYPSQARRLSAKETNKMNEPLNVKDGARVRCSVGLAVSQESIRSEAEPSGHCECTALPTEQEICSRSTVEGHFHRMMWCPEEIRWWAKTEQNAQVYRQVLARWQADGCPDPETWQDHQKDFLILPYKQVQAANDPRSPTRRHEK